MRRGDWVVLGSCGFLRLRVRRRRGGWCLLGTGWGRMVQVFQRVGFFQMGREGFGKTDWRMRGDEDVGEREWD